MNVLFLTIVPKADLYASLADEFYKNGHSVTFVSPTELDTHYEVFGPHKILFFHAGKMLNVSIPRKGLNNLLFQKYAYKAVKMHIIPAAFQLILMTTPPLGYLRSILYLKKNNPTIKFYEILRDIHPEGATHILKKIPGLYGYFRNKAQSLYDIADGVGCMSPHSVKLIQDRYLQNNKEKVYLLPNWGRKIEYSMPDDSVLTRYGLGNKYIIIYGGNMGKPQNLSIFLKLAKEKQSYSDVVFFFIGSGTEKEKLKKEVSVNCINNVRIEDAIPAKDFNELLKCASVGIISLHPQSYFANTPSKAISYWQNKIPILASLDAITDFGSYFIENSKSGLWSLATDFASLSRNFDVLYNSRDVRLKMGEAGYVYFNSNYTVDKAYASIISVIF